jgi:hypothetical protein
MLVTILVSTFFRFAYEVIKPNPPGLVAWLTGLGTLLIVGMVPTVLAPLFGGVFRHAGLAITGAIAAPVAGLASQAFALPAGTVGGTLGGLAHYAPEGVSRTSLAWAGAQAGAMGALGSTSMTGSFAKGLFGVGKTAADEVVSKKLTEGIPTGELRELRSNLGTQAGWFHDTYKALSPKGKDTLVKEGEDALERYGTRDARGNVIPNFQNMPKDEVAKFWYRIKYGKEPTAQDLKHMMKGLDSKSKDWDRETRHALTLIYQDAVARYGSTREAKAFMGFLTRGGRFDEKLEKEYYLLK